MKRRRLIKLSAYVAAGSSMATWLSSCKSDSIEIDLDGYTPSLFTNDQYAFIRDLSDTLLPETNTAGAVALGVPQMFDTIINNIMPTDNKKEYAARVNKLMNSMKDLTSMSNADKASYLNNFENDLATKDNSISQTYSDVKSKIIRYYLNTESVGTKLLNYLPVPGEYQACITLEEAGGKAWSL